MGYGDDVDGEFDVVGWAADHLSDEELAHIVGQRRGAARGGGYGRPGGRGGFGGGRGGFQGHHPAMPGRGGAGFHGRGGMPGYHAGLPAGPMGLMMPPGTPQPPWFQSALGVSPPMELMNTLPLTPQQNGGIFTSAFTTIQFQARPQRPFRGERPVATQNRSAGVLTGTQLQAQPIFVGVIPQAVEIGATDLGEWSPTAFGVRLAMTDAAQGTLISLSVSSVGAAIPAGESIVVNITLYGRALA